MSTAHERLKKDFDDLRLAVMQELMKGAPKGSTQTRLDLMQIRMDKIEENIDALNIGWRFCLKKLAALEAPKPSFWGRILKIIR